MKSIKVDRESVRVFIKMCFILVGGAIIGTLLLALVFCIPIDRAWEHYNATGVTTIEQRPGWYKYLIDYDASTADNYTEHVMMKVAATPLPRNTGENIFQYAMRAYTWDVEWAHGLEFVVDEYNGEYYACDSYERYWHGYVVFLKPLLTLFSYTDIVFMNIAIQFGLLFLLLNMLAKRKMYNLQLIFSFFWIISMQIVVMLCLDYSVCFYIYMFGVMAILLSEKARRNYIYTFLILGMLTSYMDFLTWPLVTLVMPLITFLFIEKEESIFSAVKASASWAMGYVGLWMGKWGIGSLILMDNILEDAVSRFMMRSSMKVVENEVNANFTSTIKSNFSVFTNMGFLTLLILVFVSLIVYIICKKRKMQKDIFLKNIVLLVLPIGWYAVTTNHATEHYWMTWKNAALFILIIFTAILEGFSKEKEMET